MVESGLPVFCADIGSVAKKRFGWARANGTGGQGEEHDDIDELATAVAGALATFRKAALGFECPLFVPFPEDPNLLTSAREGEGSHPWSAGAGCGALAAGLTESVWILSKVRERIPGDVPAFLGWQNFHASPSGLFVWEAFVTGKAKAGSHSSDAAAAIQEFQRAFPDLDRANALKSDRVLSLAGAALLRSGWTRDIGVLSEPCVVIQPPGRGNQRAG